MIVVSNTTPLCYLRLIGRAEILHALYLNVHITETVRDELLHPGAPPTVRSWAKDFPKWVKIYPDPPDPDGTFRALDPGERTALRLGELLACDAILLDEADARAVATQRGIRVSGTLGVVCEAAREGLLELHEALDLLRKTTFRASPELWRAMYGRKL